MDELSDTQIELLRNELLTTQQQLEKLLAANKDATQAVEPDAAIGRLTRMDAIQQQSMAKATHEGYQIRLRQIRQALRLIDDDEYGYCRRCDEPIGWARLQAKPETPFCLGCQSAAERR